MAVGVADRSTKHSRVETHSLILSDLSIQMSYDPLGLPSGIGIPETKAIPGPGFADRSRAADSGPSTTSASRSHSNKKKRTSKGKTLPEIRRSSSTPHMHNLALANSGELSPNSDKRRNKLGYHRTSVACTHCRRRKIRCLLNNDDPNGRCSNCIRLKKDCNFYPVEQTNPSDSRPQPLAKVEDGAIAPSASTPSSPRAAGSRSEQVDEYRPFTTISPNPASAGFRMQPGIDVDSNSASNPSGVPLRSHTFPYSHQMDNQWPPPGFVPPSSVPDETPSSASYWRASPSTAPSTYGSDSNMSGGQTPATMSTTSNMSYGAPHDAQGWAQPVSVQPARSVSYGHIEGVPPQFHNPHLVSQQDYRGRASPYNYPPSIDTSAGHAQGTHADTTAPLSAPLLAHTTHNYGYSPQNWSPYTLHSSGHDYSPHGRPMGGPWYAEPSHLGHVEEEAGPPMQYANQPPTFYSGP
ncbi:hypothetical protein BU16DRAFT_280725 [Lophium mytilinum]|uniref:Zn(2)-C6 fungal-type domain-containing protein n=1 Tax=Lophium mytilinum TaxID=390894 RepID=A0A6A6R4P0_9PEZI|nr:hypothetical protein BU16DRAFT_280725 [Lophium mytilinum]